MTPLPISRLEARAAGLKVYTAGPRCARSHGMGRLVFNGKCLGCIAHDRAALVAIKAAVRESTLKTAREKILRELAREAKAAADAKAKADRAKERAAEKAARAAARKKAASKATREARAAAREAAKGQGAAEGLAAPAPALDLSHQVPPWEDEAAATVPAIQEEFDSLTPWEDEAAPWD